MRDLRSRMFFAAVVVPVLLTACSSEDPGTGGATGGTGGATGGTGGATGGTGGATGGTGGATGGTGGATGGTGGATGGTGGTGGATGGTGGATGGTGGATGGTGGATGGTGGTGGATGGTGGATGGTGGATGGTGGATGGTGGATGGTGGATGGTGGVTGTGPSCAGLAASCGPGGNESCCAAKLVPGGTFKRSYDGVTYGYTDQSYPATVSDFVLDRFEITVGRFRKFAAAYTQAMTAAGAGKNPNNASDPGWSTSWNASLPTSASGLAVEVKCIATWTDSSGGNEHRPMNCINWYEAFAFCIWDGGRLPTEAEWNYAAAGGSEQRVYPWSSPASSTIIDASYAVYSVISTANVGSKGPKGDGKWGQADLAGNVWEWALDWYATPYSNPCANCANLTNASGGRSARGGGISIESNLLASHRGASPPWARSVITGARCARTP